MHKSSLYIAIPIIFMTLFLWLDPITASFFYRFNFPQKFPLLSYYFSFYENLLYLPSLLVFIFCCYLFFINYIKHRISNLKNTLSIILSIGFICSLVMFGLKPLWNRPRPLETKIYFQEKHFVPYYKIDLKSTWKKRNFHSFPSGHAAISSSLLSLLPVLLRYNKKRVCKRLFWILIPFIGIQSLSRILLGKHFLSDIFFGITISYTTIVVVNKIIFKNQKGQLI